MNDRELMELAAKAATVPGTYHEAMFGGAGLVDGIGVEEPDGRVTTFWNPLRSDEEAFRLAVLLRMDVDHNYGTVEVWADWLEEDPVAIEPCTDETRLKATRRAITKCAAAYQLRREQ